MKRSLVPILLSLALLAAACSGGSGDETSTTTVLETTTTTQPPASTATTVAATTTTLPATTTSTGPATPTWPLTGEEGFVEGAPILFVKIDNTSRGRPQAGLEAADLVFEILVEGGTPRLLAAFQSEVPDVIGPVRSVRETDAKLLFPFAPYFANSGGQGFVLDMVNEVSRDSSFPNMGSGAYFHDPGRPSVYDLMVEPQVVFERRTALRRQNIVELVHGPAPDGGAPAGTVAVSLSNQQTSGWTWSAEDGVYLRDNGGSAHLASSGEQISAANVVTIEVEQFFRDRVDAAGSPVPDYRLVGSGSLVLFRDGMAYEGTWTRENFQRTWFSFRDAAGMEIPMAVGNTWIELVPTGRSVTYE